MTSSARLLCVGEVLVEMVAGEVGQSASEPGQWIGPFPSGAPAILADQAALCGAQVSMVGCVGADPFGEACLTKLKVDGVDVSRVVVDDTRATGVAFVRYREDGSRSFIFHVADSASGQVDAGGLDGVLDGVDCLHLMGSSAFSDRAVDTMLTLFREAARRGIKVSFDPNVRKEMLTKKAHALALSEILRGATYVLASEGELPALLGEGSDAEGARALVQASADIVVVKRGAQGSSLFLAGQDEWAVPAITVVEVDPTGAGDCFGGTFLALVLQGLPPREALVLANAAGALSVTEQGPMSGNRTLFEIRTHLAGLGKQPQDSNNRQEKQ